MSNDAKGGSAPAGKESKTVQTKSGIPVQVLDSSLYLKSSFFLLVWMVLFTAGLLCETSTERLILAPLGVESQLGKEEMKRLDEFIHDKDLLKNDSSSRALIPNALPSTSSTAVTNSATPPVPASAKDVESYPYARGFRARANGLDLLKAFLTCMFCYTPTNLALLTFVAALVGGYASNLHYYKLPPELAEQLPPKSVSYLQEPPMSAAIRGFVVYLCVIAGLYVALDDPFKSTSSGQYIRLAGTISVLAFAVGYDPTRLNSWLGIVPGPKALPGSGEKT